MPDQSSSPVPWSTPWIAERAVVLQVLRDDHSPRWTRGELKGEIYDIKGRAIDKALARLENEEVVVLSGKEVWASLCAHHLDRLGMISI